MATQVVIFSLGNEEYGIPIDVVREITRLGEVRSIPQAPSFVQGLINLRGHAIPLINLHTRFGSAFKDGSALNESSYDTDSFALITEVNGKLVGLAVDKVLEVRVLENVAPPPALISAPFISGLINLSDRIIMLLKPEHILDKDELSGLSDLG